MKYLSWMIPALLFCSFCAAEAKIVDRVLVQVNDDIITLSDLNRKLAEYRLNLETKYSGEELAQMMQQAEKKALNELIEDKLMDQKAAEFGAPGDIDTRVSASIQGIMKNNNFATTEDLEKALIAQQGTTLREFREIIRKSIMREDLIDSYVKSRISLLAQEIDKYYKDHAAEFTKPEEVTISEIDIPIDANSQEAESLVNDIYNRILKGESFTVLASQYSKGPTASKGGVTPTIQLSKLNSETVKAIEGLKTGDISKPQKFKNMYVIYRMDLRQPATVSPLDEVKNEIKFRLWEQKYTPEYARFISQLREDAYIQYFTEMK
jgi:peptidyl-prolyl cis-trans isomerase SurA